MIYSAYVGDDFRSDLGYYRRYGMYKFEPNYKFRIYPKNENIHQILKIIMREIFITQHFKLNI